MGEILRGILDAKSVYSKPVFYNVTLNSIGPTGAGISVPYVGNTQIRSDTIFLMTSIVLRDDLNQITPMPLSFFKANNNGTFIERPPINDNLTEILTVQFNDSLGNCFTLPEYVQWNGDDTVQVVTIGRIPGGEPRLPFQAILIGIEYKF